MYVHLRGELRAWAPPAHRREPRGVGSAAGAPGTPPSVGQEPSAPLPHPASRREGARSSSDGFGVEILGLKARPLLPAEVACWQGR